MLDFPGQGKIKRHFRATRKLNVPNVVSHITQRAAGKERLFLEDKDHLFMLWLLKEIARNYSLTMYAFCLMPNHVHLLLNPREENLDDAMRDLFSRYARMFNRKYERKGHLFGGPYRQAVCLDDIYLLTASLYIHLNPVRAGLVNDPLSYRWSSCGLYTEADAPKAFVTPDFILDLLSGDKSEKRQRYRHLLEDSGELNIEEVMEEKDAIERFRRALSSKVPSLSQWIAKKKQVSSPSGIDILDMDELERQIKAMKKTRFANKPESIKAKKFLIEQLISRGYKRGEIAERLGIYRKTVYNILKSTIATFMPLVVFLPILSQGRFG
jgi:putative transposase